MATSPRLLDGAISPGRLGRASRVGRTSARQLSRTARDTRFALAGLAVGALVVGSAAVGSSAVMLLASLVAIAVSVVSPLVGLIALAFAAPLARPLVIPPPGIFVAMGAAMLFGVILRLPIERPRLRFPAMEVSLLGAFLVYVMAQFMAGRLDGLPGATGTDATSMFARLTEAVVTFGVAYVVLRGRSPYPILAALLASAALVAITGLAEMLGTEGAFGSLMDEPDLSGRISGVFGNPNYFGAYLGAMTALGVALAVEVKSNRLRVLLLAIAALLSTTMVLTQSRGALVAAIVGLVAIAFVRGRRAGIITVATLALVAVVAYPIFSDWRFGSDGPGSAAGLTTAAGRTEAWSAGGQLFASSPLFGVGAGRFQAESPGGIAPHNWYVQVLAELGIVGFIMWSLFLAAMIAALQGRPRPARSVGYAVLAVWMVASLTMSPQLEFRFTSAVLIAIATAAVALWTPPPGAKPDTSGGQRDLSPRLQDGRRIGRVPGKLGPYA